MALLFFLFVGLMLAGAILVLLLSRDRAGPEANEYDDAPPDRPDRSTH
jgi:hypothetical protein